MSKKLPYDLIKEEKKDITMSGHSKWANIKHKKAKADAARGVNFAKFSREIIIAAKIGGGDINGNFRLRTAVEKAKAGGLPNDTIKRAIDKGAGNLAGENFEEITYEGYGAGGVAVFIEAATDNRNRTAGDIRSYFTKFNGNLGETGCVGWMFDQKGVLTFPEDVDFDKLFEAAINLDAEDITEDEDKYKVFTSPENFQKVVEGLEADGFKAESAELTRIPQNTIEVTDEKIADKILKLLDKLEEHDDVQNVYANFDISDDILQKLEA